VRFTCIAPAALVVDEAIAVLLAHLIFTVPLTTANPTAAVPLSEVTVGVVPPPLAPPPPHAARIKPIKIALTDLMNIFCDITTPLIE
jgi:hypothetical protein